MYGATEEEQVVVEIEMRKWYKHSIIYDGIIYYYRYESQKHRYSSLDISN